MNEFNTGSINLEQKDTTEKWFCPLCQDWHTESKEEYEKMFGKEE